MFPSRESVVLYAIYFRDPASGACYPLISSGHRTFTAPDQPPALFAQHANAAKVFRQWRKQDAKAAASDSWVDRPTFVGPQGEDLPVSGQDQLSNYIIVPVRTVPDFSAATPHDAKGA